MNRQQSGKPKDTKHCRFWFAEECLHFGKLCKDHKHCSKYEEERGDFHGDEPAVTHTDYSSLKPSKEFKKLIESLPSISAGLNDGSPKPSKLRETGFCAKSGLYCYACGRLETHWKHQPHREDCECISQKELLGKHCLNNCHHAFVPCFSAPDVQQEFSRIRETLSKFVEGWDTCNDCRKMVADKRFLQTDIYIAHAEHLLKEKDAEIQRLKDENTRLHYLEEDADAHVTHLQEQISTMKSVDAKLADDLESALDGWNSITVKRVVGLLRGENENGKI